LEAIIPDKNLCDILDMEENIACFKVIEKLQIQNKIISYAEQYYPASRYKFHSKI
jgi:GntR family histidine utilization transcriptional repressor